MISNDDEDPLRGASTSSSLLGASCTAPRLFAKPFMHRTPRAGKIKHQTWLTKRALLAHGHAVGLHVEKM